MEVLDLLCAVDGSHSVMLVKDEECMISLCCTHRLVVMMKELHLDSGLLVASDFNSELLVSVVEEDFSGSYPIFITSVFFTTESGKGDPKERRFSRRWSS